MRVIPVIDIRGGIVVHARRGRREEYAPLQPTADPIAVATALCERAGSSTLYVADLDAIEHGEPNDTALRALTAVADVWLDAGAHEVPPARRVIGTESMTDLPTGPVILSIDLRDGRLISPRPDLGGRDAGAAVPLARELRVSEVLVIDLALVGSGAGPPLRGRARALGRAPGRGDLRGRRRPRRRRPAGAGGGGSDRRAGRHRPPRRPPHAVTPGTAQTAER